MKNLLLIFASMLMLLSDKFEFTTNAQETGDAVITHPPFSTTVALGSNATFTCSGYGRIIWRVNQIHIQNEEIRDGDARDFGIFANINDVNTSQLAMLASNRNNGSQIECLVMLSVTDVVVSQPAFIYAYDFPYPPSNLTITQSGLDLHLSWEAPFSLDGEEITYIVRATNTRTGEGREPDLEAVSPQLAFNESIGERDCSLYEFKVYSLNAFGRSTTSVNGSHAIPTEPTVIRSTDVVWNISMENGTSVTLSFDVPTPCEQYPVNDLNIALDRISPQMDDITPSDSMVRLPTIVLRDDETFMNVLVEEEDGLQRNSIYVATIEAVNKVGRTLSEEVVIYTTGLQSSSVMVFEVNDTASVTCNFALGSDALGCEVSFYTSSMSDSMELLFAQNITREPSSINTLNKNIPLMGQLEGKDIMNITVLTSEWLADGSISSIEIEADVHIIELIISTTTMETSTSVPTEHSTTTFIPVTTISSQAPTDPKTPVTLYIIIGAISAFVVLLLLLVITTVLFIVSLRLRKKAHTASAAGDDNQVMEQNVAYGALDKPKRRNNNVLNEINVTQDDSMINGASSNRSSEPTVQEMVTNTAYGALSTEGAIRLPPPIPPKGHRNLKKPATSHEHEMVMLVPNQAYGVPTSHLVPPKHSGTVDVGNSLTNGGIRTPCTSTQVSSSPVTVGVASYVDVDAVMGCSPAYAEIKNTPRTQSGPLYEEIKAKTKALHVSFVYDDVASVKVTR